MPSTRTDVRISVCPNCSAYRALSTETDICALRMVNGQLRTCKPSRMIVYLHNGPYNAETLNVKGLLPMMILPYEKSGEVFSAKYKYVNGLVYRFIGSDESVE